jgi:D-alanyl-D-alanine carboxypeptidase
VRQVALALLLVVACRGGRDGSAPTPPPLPPKTASVPDDPWAPRPAVDAAPEIPGPSLVLPPGVDDASALLAPIRRDRGLPALGAAIWKDGKLVAIGMTGLRDTSDPRSWVKLDDTWHLGSDTKAMTATLVGIFVDRGMLHWSDTVATLFAGETIDPGYAKVTLDQLLEHRGGAPGTYPLDLWAKLWELGDAPNALQTAVRALLARPPANTPGTFEYANAGYMIVGAALERRSKRSWQELMRTELFAPLAMTSCGFGAPADGVRGHRMRGALVGVPPGPQADNPPGLGPAGTVHCSLTDWGKFLVFHTEGGTLLSKATLAHLHAPPKDGDYAAGWMVTDRPWGGGTVYTHSGSNTMWFATAWLAPQKHLVLAAVTNVGDAGPAVDAAFGPLLERYASR